MKTKLSAPKDQLLLPSNHPHKPFKLPKLPKLFKLLKPFNPLKPFHPFKPFPPFNPFPPFKPLHPYTLAITILLLGACNDKPGVLPQDNRLKVYPNPVQDVAHIAFPNPQNSAYTVLVFDPAGAVLLEKEESLADPRYQVQVSDQAEGTYHVVLKKDNTTITRQFVKTK